MFTWWSPMMVDAMIASMQEDISDIKAAVHQAAIDRAEMRRDIKQIIKHQEHQNGRLAKGEVRMTKIETDVHEEALILARAEAAREAVGLAKRRDLAYATFAIGSLAIAVPVLLQFLVGT